jgi:hypothetical protein
MKTAHHTLAAAILLLFSACSRSERTEAPQAPFEEPQPQTATAADQPAESDTPGLSVGEKAPSFQLKDQQGREQTLTQILEDGQAALVFYRSAEW